MKKTLISIMITAQCVMLSCTPKQSQFDIDMAIVIDLTDKLPVYPTAEEIASQLGIQSNPNQSIRILCTTISDRQINDATVITFPREGNWSGNSAIHRAKVQYLTKQLQQCLDKIRRTDTSSHSIVFKSVASQINRLARSTAENKYLLLFSNLYENSQINLYDKRTIALLRDNPDAMQKQLAQYAPINTARGVQVWLVYKPLSYGDNNLFMPIAECYKHYLESRDMQVQIATKFLMQ